MEQNLQFIRTKLSRCDVIQFCYIEKTTILFLVIGIFMFQECCDLW